MSRREEIQRLQRESRQKLRERNRAEREAKRAEERRAHETRLKVRAEKKLAVQEAAAKNAYLQSGGDPAGWTKYWKVKKLELLDAAVDASLGQQPKIVI